DLTPQLFEGGVGLEFTAIAVTELWVALRLMSEPLAQFGAGTDFLEPQVEFGFFLAHAARPDPVNQNPVAVGTGGGLVNAFEAAFSHACNLGPIAGAFQPHASHCSG